MVGMKFGAWEAQLAPECGDNLVSLKCNGKEILRAPENLEALRERPCLYGFPLILPANRLDGGVFCFEDKEYHLPINEPLWNNHIHGTVRDAEFTLLSCEENCVKTVLENKGEYYPFSFCIYMEDRLQEDGWVRKMMLQNTDSRAMPYTLGFHTTFRDLGEIVVPLAQAYEINERYIPTGKLLPLTEFQRRCTEGICLTGEKLTGSYTTCGNTVRIGDFVMTVSEQFDHWVLFNGNGQEGFVCIEPQCGAVNGLRSGNHRVLLPGEEEVFTLCIVKI